MVTLSGKFRKAARGSAGKAYGLAHDSALSKIGASGNLGSVHHGGARAASGSCFLRLFTKDQEIVRKLTLLKEHGPRADDPEGAAGPPQRMMALRVAKSRTGWSKTRLLVPLS